jgi:enterochelin esterase family protein
MLFHHQEMITMVRRSFVVLVPVLVAGWLMAGQLPALVAAGEEGAARSVSDGGAFFSKPAIEKANAEIAAIKKRFHKDLMVETFGSAPEDIKAVDLTDAKAKRRYFTEWAGRRATALRIDGVYVLICKKPSYLMPMAGRLTRQKAFTDANLIELGDRLLRNLKARKNDDALIEGVNYVRDAMAKNLAVTAALETDPKVGPLSPWQLRAFLQQKPTDKDLDRLRDHIYATFGKQALESGTAPAHVQDTLVCWAIAITADQAAKGVVPKLLLNNTQQRADMRPIGPGSNVFVLFADVTNFTETNYVFEVSGLRVGAGHLQIEHYNPAPESLPRDKVPRGTVTKAQWKSKIFEGTVRDYYVYVPAQYDPQGLPACVMVFQDGAAYLRDPFRTSLVLDNLIHRKEIPLIIGIFIDPGVIPGKEGEKPVSNRSVEYDTLSDKYVRFLLEEILPEVGKKYKLRADASSRAICGISSGGICAFTVAWEKPDQFGKVLSHVGSFTNIRGGHVYPALIRKTAKKNLRVFLQDGARDLDNEHGNWPLANQEMAAALRFKGYDFQLVMGQGFHSGKHGASILPESLRWLWRDYQPPEDKKDKPTE